MTQRYYAGVDTAQFPGLDVMAAWKDHTNIAWCDLYLWPAPSQRKNYGWMPQRAALLKMGYGIMPVYLGRQTAGPGKRLSKAVAAARAEGAADGTDATNLMKKAGFAPGWRCAMDVESPPAKGYDPALYAYLEAWSHALESAVDAHYKTAVYCSHLISGKVHQLLPTARVYDFNVGKVSLKKHAVPGTKFPAPAPTKGSFATQREQNCLVGVPGTKKTVLVDLNTALSANPGV